MELKTAFGLALKQVRNRQQLTQEDFSETSSRTYLSTLERGIKSPTLEKVEQLSKVLKVHPLSVMVMAYLNKEDDQDLSSLLKSIENEVNTLQDR
ncbi:MULTISPECIES: helix-turn-helix domain-containing protein [Pseudomonas syringae group]|uniref:helix-turn-helix domain-containing protein n=1 Tax=Pseudomonas syringae group TaxID=136849 RepID=UPI000C12CDB8|nr:MULTISPECIES: helix-turn-helix transcriptional regulator [Pseudomonas syringae group]MCH5519145.1 helix-turn-helix domain-containing protein [Pseudomonas syringae pv. lapsa]PHX29322.1 XRE family transcriptional regulator [Pseudomonas amygdali pv. morsprunorum]